MHVAVERELADEYLHRTSDEVPLVDFLDSLSSDATIVAAQGFEQRTCGLLDVFARSRAEVDQVIIARYVNEKGYDDAYTPQFEQLAERVAPGRWTVIPNKNDGAWVDEALRRAGDIVVIGITGVSNRAMFRTLDRLEASGKTVFVAYTEAKQYWPKKREWDDLRRKLTGHQSIAELIDNKPWMFGYEHHVELVPGHEGYDASGTGRALVAFLPFKASRLAAVLGDEDYAEKLFIAGKPPSPQLYWRLDALKEINESLTRGSRVEEMSTFGYRRTLEGLSNLLLGDDSLLWRYDVHFAALGSKLQTIGSWALSRIVPSITVVTSVPSRYYKNAFSEGIGPTWVFRLIDVGR